MIKNRIVTTCLLLFVSSIMHLSSADDDLTLLTENEYFGDVFLEAKSNAFFKFEVDEATTAFNKT